MRAHELDELGIARLHDVHPLAMACAELHHRALIGEFKRPPGGAVVHPALEVCDREAGSDRLGHCYPVPAGSAPAVNTWTHLAATYDGTTLRLYKNGAQIASTTRAGTINSGTAPLRLGGNNIWGEWFAGQLDDVRVYDQPLTAAQIQTDMNTPVG